MQLLSIITKVLDNQYTWNLAVLVLAAALLFLTIKVSKDKFPIKYYWVFLFIYLFLIRSYDFFQLWTVNQDEEQWLICARSMAHEPLTWYRHFMIFDYTRFFTIFPLAIIVLITQAAGYAQARIMQILLTFIFIRLSYSAAARWFDKSVALIMTAMFAVFAGMSRNADMVAYNSELFASVLFILFVWQIKKAIDTSSFTKGFFIAGIFLGLMPFAKEQAVLIAFFAGLAAVSILVLRKEIKSALYLAGGGIAGFLIVFVPVLVQNGFEKISTLFQIALEYSDQGLDNVVHSENPYAADVFLKSFFLNKEYLPFTILLIAALVFLVLNIKSLTKNQKLFQLVLWAGFLAAIYSIYKPGNNFFHYSLLLWPFLFLSGCMAIHHAGVLKKFIWIAPMLVLLTQVHDLRFRQLYPLHKLFAEKGFGLDEVQQVINDNSAENDRILVWGWSNKYYVVPGRERGGGYLYPKFAIGNYSGKDFALQVYVNDLKRFQPKIILEAIGEDQFDFKDYSTQSISAASPELKAELENHYSLIYNSGSYHVYSRSN
ncbi:MAG: glycosyltransferase family 39 protein [Bacteroidia bacterium]